ncbi:MAG: hypothetical protein J1E61_00450 [Lachnospiraceae bacterium]|nr:hypothetical protein [Lachnospiraceae bacterium]
MDLINTVIEIEGLFYGGNLIFRQILYIILLYLLVKGGNICHKIWIRYTILILCIIYNPVVIYLCHKILGGITTDVRLFYLLPIFPLCAYGMTDLIFSKGKLNYILMIAFTILIVSSGKTFYDQGAYTKAENVYKIPQETIYVCEIIDQDDSYKKALVPNELLDYIRQYDSRIEMCYGRYDASESFAQSFSNGTLSEEEFESYMQKVDFNYIIYDSGNVEMIQMFHQYGYTVIGETEKYSVLKR